MPAETPLVEIMLPSSTQRAVGTQVTLGPCFTAHSQAALFVVALRPSSIPARDRIVAPVQTETIYLSCSIVSWREWKGDGNSRYLWISLLDEIDLFSHIPAGATTARDDENIYVTLVCRRRQMHTIMALTLALHNGHVVVCTLFAARQVIRECCGRHNLLTKASSHHGRRDGIHSFAEN